MISKKAMQSLLNSLTVKEIVSTDFNKIDNNVYYNVVEVEILQSINIYELADRCIEKAKAQSYQISAHQPIVQDDTGAQVINYWYKGYIVRFDTGSHEPPYQILGFDCNVKSAPEAIFKAYEWLLEKGKIK